MAHFIHIIFVKHPFPSKATGHLDYQTCNQRLYFHSNQTCFTRSANSLRMTLLCALATANPVDSMQGNSHEDGHIIPRIWTLVHLTENWFSYQVVTPVADDIRLSTVVLKVYCYMEGPDELQLSCRSSKDISKGFPFSVFWAWQDGWLSSSQIHTTSTFCCEATHPGPCTSTIISVSIRAKAWYAAKSNLGSLKLILASYGGSKPETWQSKCWFFDTNVLKNWGVNSLKDIFLYLLIFKGSSCSCENHQQNNSPRDSAMPPTKWKLFKICVDHCYLIHRSWQCNPRHQ